MSALYDRHQARVYGAALAVCDGEACAAEASVRTFLWVQVQAARLSRCPQSVIEQAIELQAVAFGRQRARGRLRSGFTGDPSETRHSEEGLPPPSP